MRSSEVLSAPNYAIKGGGSDFRGLRLFFSPIVFLHLFDDNNRGLFIDNNPQQKRQNGMMLSSSIFSGKNGGNDGTSPLDYMAGMLSMMPNTSSRGGRLQRKNLYDGKTEPTGYLRRMKDANSGEVGDVVGLNNDGTYNVSYSNGIQPMALQAPELTVLGNYNPRRMSPEEKEALMRVQRGLDERPIGGELKNNQYRTMPTNSEANTFADAWASQTAPTVGHLIAAGLKPLDLVTGSIAATHRSIHPRATR